jgi:DNA repair exonuclease SbcCD nuclease subunit
MTIADSIRILFLSDTHLGFDLPMRPRVERRRRGPDFFRNFEIALEPAFKGEVDLVVHGGDLFFRARMPPAIVDRTFAIIHRLVESGIHFYLVPGNHERSRIPPHLLSWHPRLHIFDEPKTYLHASDKGTIALAGFPYARNVRSRFTELLSATRIERFGAEMRLLCIHQVVEGAQVGPANFTFRSGAEVIPGAAIPNGFDVVLSGHIHRGQLLEHDLAGRQLSAPVIFSGSTERTSFAEKDETKGYVLLEIDELMRTSFVPLRARPMVQLTLAPREGQIERAIREGLRDLAPDSIVRIQLAGDIKQGLLTASRLRELAPATMNVAMREYNA